MVGELARRQDGRVPWPAAQRLHLRAVCPYRPALTSSVGPSERHPPRPFPRDLRVGRVGPVPGPDQVADEGCSYCAAGGACGGTGRVMVRVPVTLPRRETPAARPYCEGDAFGELAPPACDIAIGEPEPLRCRSDAEPV